MLPGGNKSPFMTRNKVIAVMLVIPHPRWVRLSERRRQERGIRICCKESEEGGVEREVAGTLSVQCVLWGNALLAHFLSLSLYAFSINSHFYNDILLRGYYEMAKCAARGNSFLLFLDFFHLHAHNAEWRSSSNERIEMVWY